MGHIANAYSGTEQYIFVSYSHRDDIALRVIEQLQEHYRVWYDSGIESGSQWMEAIEHHIRDASIFMPIVTSNYWESENCRQEARLALAMYHIRYYPINIEDIPIPAGINMYAFDKQGYNYFNNPSEEQLFETFKVAPLLAECALPLPASDDWGPKDRRTFLKDEPAGYVVLNSATDHPVIGDERRFALVREASSSKPFEERVVIEAGKQYEVCVWFDNNCAAGMKARGMATNITLRAILPPQLRPGDEAQMRCVLRASNARPTEVWATVTFARRAIDLSAGQVPSPGDTQPMTLSYVANSATLHVSGSADQTIVSSDALFGRGVNIAYDKRYWGVLPPGREFSGSITYLLKADLPSWWSEILVAYEGQGRQGHWKEWLENVHVGQKLDFFIYYKNTGTVKQSAVTVFCTIPDCLSPVEGSVLQDSDNFANAIFVGKELFGDRGLVIGRFYPGQAARVTFTCKVCDTPDSTDGETYVNMRTVTQHGSEFDRVELVIHHEDTSDIDLSLNATLPQL